MLIPFNKLCSMLMWVLIHLLIQVASMIWFLLQQLKAKELLPTLD